MFDLAPQQTEEGPFAVVCLEDEMYDNYEGAWCECGVFVGAEDWHLCGDPPVVTVPPMEDAIIAARRKIRDELTLVEEGHATGMVRKRSYRACLREAERSLTEALEMVQEAEGHR